MITLDNPLKKPRKTAMLELDDGSVLNMPVKVLTIAKTDEYWDIQQAIYDGLMALAQNEKDDGGAEKFLGKPFSYISELVREAEKKSLNLQEPLWRLMTGMEDVSWIYSAAQGELEKLENEFLSVNPRIENIKKKLREIQLNQEMVMSLVSGILSAEAERQESSTGLLEDTE